MVPLLLPDLLPLHESIEIEYKHTQKEVLLLHIKEYKEAKNADNLKDNLPVTKRESEVLFWVSYSKKVGVFHKTLP